MKRLLTLLIAACLMLSVFSGCAISKNPTDESPVPTTDSPAPSDGVTGTEGHDFAAAYAKYEPEMVVATVNGMEITWKEYFYWTLNALTYIEQYMGVIENFNEDFSGMSYNEYIRTIAENYCIQYRGLDYYATLEGISLSAEAQASLDAQLQYDIENYSADKTEEGFNKYLDENFIGREVYDYFNRVSLLYTEGFVHFCGESGEKILDTDISEYIDASGFMVAKHILLSTKNDDDTYITDEEKAEKLALAEQLIEELSKRTDLDAAFDEYIAEYGEDPGAAYYTDGYCFTDGQMITEFETATKALAVGEMTMEVVEGMYGYHIILRGEVTPESVPMGQETPQTIRQLAASNKYNEIVNGWLEATTIEYTDGFKMDFNEVFAK